VGEVCKKEEKGTAWGAGYRAERGNRIANVQVASKRIQQKSPGRCTGNSDNQETAKNEKKNQSARGEEEKATS